MHPFQLLIYNVYAPWCTLCNFPLGARFCNRCCASSWCILTILPCAQHWELQLPMMDYFSSSRAIPCLTRVSELKVLLLYGISPVQIHRKFTSFPPINRNSSVISPIDHHTQRSSLTDSAQLYRICLHLSLPEYYVTADNVLEAGKLKKKMYIKRFWWALAKWFSAKIVCFTCLNQGITSNSICSHYWAVGVNARWWLRTDGILEPSLSIIQPRPLDLHASDANFDCLIHWFWGQISSASQRNWGTLDVWQLLINRY